jgi:hypothetical protein
MSKVLILSVALPEADLRALYEWQKDMLDQIDGLRSLLKEAGLQIEYLHGKFQPTGSGETVLARIRAELESTP